ncbi:hypothetical protein D8911_00790 [Levilactobacillus brevis]|nr:hypothetical protein D8911_00790 [Levilactobacillus brevis]
MAGVFKVAKQVLLEYNGHNIAELTRKYDYSQRWVRQMIQLGKNKGKLTK